MKATKTRKIKKEATPLKRVAAKAATHSAWKSKTASEPAIRERKTTAPLAMRRINVVCDGR